jgi:putative membrane protein
MKKTIYCIVLGVLAAGTACSRIDANTSNSVPTSDAYAATVTGNHSGSAVVGSPATTNLAAGGMMVGTRTITESSFLMEAASSSMMEVQLGRLALERSAHPEVKKFGQMMVDHHTKSNQELTSIAAGMNVTLPTSLLPEHQQLVDKLSMLTGTAFDDVYMDEIENAHERDIALFEVVSNTAPTTSVRAFAIRTLPVLRTHEHHADELENKVKQ